MENILNRMEIRVLGCLIEKELATPEYYPLSLNALTNACNQRSNRNPIMTMDESEVSAVLESLRTRQLALVSAEGGRVAKYRHALMERLRLDPAELALLAELLLRGPQTAGELRIRGERMHPFADLAAVEEALQELAERTPPLVALLPRMPGHKEQRYTHMFGAGAETADETRELQEDARHCIVAENDRIANLEREVSSLRAEVADLRRSVEEFKAQFA
jgi:uncharacterized protein YceH (UPF0502 family)